MPKPTNDLIRLIRDLQQQDDAKHQTVTGAGLAAQMAQLRAWQSRRLSATYADLLANPTYRPACEFFLSDIYAERDFTQRDHDVERVYEVLLRYLPESMLTLLGDTVRLNRLTHRLDQALLDALLGPLGLTGEITPELYAQGYRVCDNYAERKTQIEQLAAVLSEAAHGARNPVFAVSLRLARGPAQRAGWDALVDFLERGYRACRPMKNVDYFVNAIQSRETILLERIFAGHPQPFQELQP